MEYNRKLRSKRSLIWWLRNHGQMLAGPIQMGPHSSPWRCPSVEHYDVQLFWFKWRVHIHCWKKKKTSCRYKHSQIDICPNSDKKNSTKLSWKQAANVKARNVKCMKELMMHVHMFPNLISTRYTEWLALVIPSWVWIMLAGISGTVQTSLVFFMYFLWRILF